MVKVTIPSVSYTHLNPVEVIGAGDIGAGVGFKDIRTGDTLCDETATIVLESMDFPEPVIGIAVEPKTQKDMDKLSNGCLSLIHIYDLLARLDLDALSYELRHRAGNDASQQRKNEEIGRAHV